MIPDNVTLIVKAPNQQIDDQNVECQSSWTVRQLKGHLSEVYPSKPVYLCVIKVIVVQAICVSQLLHPFDKVLRYLDNKLEYANPGSTDEQKIIYSGQLLDDNTVLKDVLRTYESQIAHTMHLVCTPKRRMPDAQPVKVNPVANEGLRHRNVNNETVPPVENPVRPEMRQNDQNHTVEMQNYISSYVNNYGRVPPYPVNYNFGGNFPAPNDPATLANHMMMMQQAYLQYMQQYANMWQATGNNPAAPTTEPPPAPAPEVPAPPAEDDDQAARDWLDYLYKVSRLAILFSFIYLYGSPARLLLVLLLAVAGYLHQIGFFRDLHINPPNVNQPFLQQNRQGNRQRAAEADGVADNAEPVANNGDRMANNADRAANAEGIANVAEPVVNANGAQDADRLANPERLLANGENVANNAEHVQSSTTATENNNEPPQSLISVTWMIFTSFFASLIPDIN